MSGDAGFVVVLVTASGSDEAESIAARLVEEQLAACVNVIPGCRSIYRWEGKLQRENEALMVIKSRRDRFDRLEARVRELHSYDVPEVIALDIEAASSGYLDFLSAHLP
jgi:periplasmic divalent cation tolerance protein